MEILVFTLNAIVVYLISDAIVSEIERRRGEVLKQRHAIFFAIFLVLIMLTFELLRRLFGAP